jgi:Domain of unknown function (DUF4136)
MRRLPQLLVPLALLVACAAPETLVQSIDTTAITAAATFGIEAPDASGAADPAYAERLQAAIEGEIVRTLSAKGYRQVALAQAELKVSYRLAPMGRVARDERENPQAESRTSMGPGDPYGNYQPLAGTGAGTRQGMLLVTITAAKSGAVVWQATSEGTATSASSAIGMAARSARAALAKIPTAQRRGS